MIGSTPIFILHCDNSLNQEQDCVITFVYFKIKNDRKSSGGKYQIKDWYHFGKILIDKLAI